MVGEVSQLPDWQDIPVVINFCNNKQGKGDEEKHPEDPTIAIPFDEEFPALIRVCVVGHSFIRRLRDHLFVEKGPDFNMGLDRGSVKVTFLSRGGDDGKQLLEWYKSQSQEFTPAYSLSGGWF